MRQEKSWFIASVAVSLIVAALVVAPGAWAASTYKILHVFRRFSGGQGPRGTLVSDAAGNLYGTTFTGGSSSCACGVVFKLAPNPDGTWTEHVLHRFTGGTDGSNGSNGDPTPSAGVILDAAGNLYGTTYSGGSGGWGTVFKLAPNPDGTWTEHLLHRFTGGTDGANPYAGVILDAAGNLYGTTVFGGSSSCGCGVVFKLAPNPDGTWTEHVLHRFTDADGDYPVAGMIFDAAGNLYGTTYSGGSPSVSPQGGLGTVFKLTPNPDGTWTEHVLHTFTGGTGGALPVAGVILDAAGNLYGTTLYGGGLGKIGVVFELTRRASGGWSERVLHAFLGYGSLPYAGLLRGASGNLYGAVSFGTSGGGLVFEIKP